MRFFLIKSRILSKQNYSGIVLSHYYALVIFWKGCETQLPVIRRSLYTIITLRDSPLVVEEAFPVVPVVLRSEDTIFLVAV